MASAVAPGNRMDPTAPLPQGEVLMLSPLRPSSPFARLAAREVRLAEHVEVVPTRKPLRPPKERHPIADAVDLDQVRRPEAGMIVEAVTPAAPAPAAPPATVTTYPGGADQQISIPPDTTGAVGRNHVFTAHNDDIWIYDRNGTLIQHVSLDAFWQALGMGGSTFDPRAVYDPHEDRFIFVTMADATKPTSSLYIAVTTSGDPTAGWVGDAIRVDDSTQGEVWLDYPSVGFTSDKITVQVNLFTRDANRFAGSTVYAINKLSLYNPPHRPAMQRFVLTNKGATQVPAVTYDPGVSDQYLLADWTPNYQGDGYLVLYVIAGLPGPIPATFTQIGFIAAGGHIWDSFPPGDFAPQDASPHLIDVGDDRLLCVVLSGKVFYCCHGVMLPTNGPTRSAIQWWEIDEGTKAVRALGRVDDPQAQIFYAFPTLAVNGDGDLLIGCSQFSASTYGSASFVLRRNGQAAQPAYVFAAGTATYYKVFSGTDNRWGDYSATQVDPIDNHSFWTVQEYVAATDMWATKWAHIHP